MLQKKTPANARSAFTLVYAATQRLKITIKDLADKAEVHKQTIYNWQKKDKEGYHMRVWLRLVSAEKKLISEKKSHAAR